MAHRSVRAVATTGREVVRRRRRASSKPVGLLEGLIGGLGMRVPMPRDAGVQRIQGLVMKRELEMWVRDWGLFV